MSSTYSEIRSQAMQVDARESAPTGEDVYAGRTYFDTSTGRWYMYTGSKWEYIQMTSTSTSLTTTSISTTSTSITTTSTSTTSSSTSTTNTSTSTSTTLW